MEIDLERFSEEELVELNHKIVARLRFLAQQRAHEHMLAFAIGEKVSFTGGDGERITGILVKYNRKTVTVLEDGGRSWNVSPGLLRKAGGGADGGKVVHLKPPSK